MKVAELMTPKVHLASPGESLRKVAKRMAADGVGFLPVGENDRLVGTITDRDIVVRAVAEGRDPSSTKVGDVATREVQTLTPDSSVDDAIKLVREQNVRRIPVVEDGRPAGIVSIGDLAIERDTDSALADISSEPPNN